MMLAITLALAALCPQQPAASPQVTPALETVIIVGGSVSDGFGLMSELGAVADYGNFLEVALGDSAGTILPYGHVRFYQQPLGFGQKQVQKSVRSDPTLVFALDFPFWYGYGLAQDCDERMQRLEECIKQLDRFKCPVLIGDFPDMTPALKGSSQLMGGGPILLPQQIPDTACRQALNDRLHSWIESRPNLHLFPLNFFVEQVRSTSLFEFRGIRYEPDEKAALIQSDLLHPTTRGTVASVLYALHILAEAELIDETRVNWDAKALETAVYKSLNQAREERAAKRKKREERKRARAKKEADKAKKKGQEAPEGGGRWAFAGAQ